MKNLPNEIAQGSFLKSEERKLKLQQITLKLLLSRKGVWNPNFNHTQAKGAKFISVIILHKMKVMAKLTSTTIFFLNMIGSQSYILATATSRLPG